MTATTTNSVKVAGNGTADGETRVVFGGATCASGTTCQASKSDDDANNDGIGDNPVTNGAVAQFVRAAQDDTAGLDRRVPDGRLRLEHLQLLLDVRGVSQRVGRHHRRRLRP